jgi:hypothetical protein
MARRKYRSPAVSTAGHHERPPDSAPDESFAQPIEPQTEYGKPEPDAAAEPQHFSTGLGEQLRQQQQHQQADALDHYIAQAFPGATPNERQWLRMNQHHLQNPMLVHHAAGIALQRGVARNSPEFLHFVGQLLDRHAAAQAHPAPASPMPPPMPAHLDLEKVESPDHEPEAASIHFSAPVSRGDHGHSIEPDLSPSQVRLTPEEREHAKAAGIDEIKYAEGKLKLQKMKKAKLISE